MFGSLTDQLNHSRRDNSIAAGPQAAGVHRLVEVMRSILRHAAQNLLSTPKMSVSFADSLLSHSLRSGPGHRRPMSGRVLQQEAGRGPHGRSSGWRFPFQSAPLLPLGLFMWRLPFVSLGLTKLKHLLTDHAMHQLLQLRSWYAMWNVSR